MADGMPIADLADLAERCYADPLLYVETMWPWMQAGTSLARQSGPDHWQVLALKAIGDAIKAGQENVFIAIRSGHGIGKRLALDTIVDTPIGRRRWGDLVEGDLLFGSDGNPTRIIARHPSVNQPMLRVTFDDGSSVVAGPEHQWSVRGRTDRRNGTGWRVMTTEQIVDAGVLRKNGAAQARQWEIPTVAPVQYPHADLPADPYRFGLWLGDGSPDGRMTINEHDIDVLQHACVVPMKLPVRGAFQSIPCISSAQLRQSGMFGLRSFEKFIPDPFLYSSADQRAELLRGLMDSDGEVSTDGSCIFGSTSMRLVDGVMWLARSLGGKAQLQPATKHPRYAYKGEMLAGRDFWRCTIAMPDGFRLFYSERRQSRINPRQARYLTRFIASIEPVENCDAMCVTVDAPDSLYCANDFIVTHNTAFISWITKWWMFTRPMTRGVVTANTKNQLSTKTWRELSKWHTMALDKPLFDYQLTSFKSATVDNDWVMDAVPWSEHNSEAFAGLHADEVCVIFDEASKISDKIWEVVDGAFTTRGLWVVCGNPTQKDGRFAQCFGKFRNRWIRLSVDARDVRMTNKDRIRAMAEDWGVDSDYFKVRVRGLPPSASSLQLISESLVDGAINRRIERASIPRTMPLLMGIDVARQGDDESVFIFRRGRIMYDEVVRLRIPDTMQVASHAAMWINRLQPDTVFVDATGLGAGVFDRLVQLGHGSKCIEVHNGSQAQDEKVYENKRIENWVRVREWLKTGKLPEGCPDLRDELVGPEFGFSRKTDRMKLESKEDMKARGLPSPNIADALTITFSEQIAIKLGDLSQSQLEPEHV